MYKTINDIDGNHHVKRAIEVALVNNHSIAFIGNNPLLNYAFVQLVNYLRLNDSTVLAATPCPCGNYGSKKVACECDVNEVIAHRQTGRFKAAMECDIVVQTLCRDHYDNVGGRHRDNDHKYMMKRVTAARGLRMFGYYEEMDFLTHHVWSAAIAFYSMGEKRCKQVASVATSIARLAGGDCMEAVHMVEALQYYKVVNDMQLA